LGIAKRRWIKKGQNETGWDRGFGRRGAAAPLLGHAALRPGAQTERENKKAGKRGQPEAAHVCPLLDRRTMIQMKTGLTLLKRRNGVLPF